MVKNKKITGGILIIAILLLIVAQGMTAIPGGHNQIPAQSGNLIQMQNAGNGTFFILTYNTPSGTQYIKDNSVLHANTINVYIFNTQEKFKTELNLSIMWNNNTQHQKYAINEAYQQVRTTSINLPNFNKATEINITIGQNTMQENVQSIPISHIPYYNSGALGFFIFIGIIMTLATILGIIIAGIIIKRAKYFPPISSRIWITIIIMGAIGLYSIYTAYYYDIPNIPWEVLSMPFIFIISLIVLDTYPSSAKSCILIQMKDEPGHGELETGIWSILEAPSKEIEIPEIDNKKYRHSGMQYIDSRSYLDFLKRLIGIKIEWVWEEGEYPEPLPKPHIWKMKDRKDKQHPYDEGYLLEPKSNPAIVKIATKPDNKIFKKKKHFLKISMSGKHMELVHKFLAEYTTMIEAGKQIRSLTKENAQLLAEAKKGQNEMHKEIIQEIADRIYKTDIAKKPKTEDVKEESKELARKDPEEGANE